MAIVLASILLLAAPAMQAQTRTREVVRMPAGGNTVTIRSESTGHVFVSVSRGARHATFMEFSPTLGENLPRADSALALDPTVKAAPGEVVEYDGPFFTDRHGNTLRLSRRVRSTGSTYQLYLSDDTGVHATVTPMSPAQYKQFRAGLNKAVKLAYDMM